ncbi:hypothetical protein [Marinicella marina]|uniref:hypothetical protein n=1 Tax=Marinicella marina TaxID=2996016 RepID=UPI0024BBEF4C|nr:hypothetical protein [Marinicella marina]MDJ1139637.1 hypothetical protein [Marinicella marina]
MADAKVGNAGTKGGGKAPSNKSKANEKLSTEFNTTSVNNKGEKVEGKLKITHR